MTLEVRETGRNAKLQQRSVLARADSNLYLESLRLNRLQLFFIFRLYVLDRAAAFLGVEITFHVVERVGVVA